MRVVLPEEGSIDIPAGTLVTLLGSYRRPSPPRNPGEPDWLALSAQSGRVGTITILHDEQITLATPSTLGQRTAGWFWRAKGSIRSRAIHALGIESAPTDAKAVLGALILGVRDPGFQEIYHSFQRVGVAHMLAISGFHVAIMLWLAVLLVRLIGEHPRLEALILVVIILGILALLPLRPPIIRAILIVIVLMGAGGLGRRYDRVTLLAWIATALVLFRPLDLFSLGFQLSFGITALLLFLPASNRSDQQAFVKAKHRGMPAAAINHLWKILKVNTACWLVATPVIMLKAGVLSLLAPVAALILIPLILLLMIIGYTQLIVGMVSLPLARSIETLTLGISRQTSGLVNSFDSIPGSSVNAPNLGTPWTLFATTIIAIFVLRPSRRKNTALLAAAAVVATWAGIIAGTGSRVDGLRVDMLDVGNGSCFVLQSGSQSAIFDLGSLDRRVAQQITQSAHSIGARPVQTVILSHDNLDHFNGQTNNTKNLGVQRVFVSEAMDHEPSDAWVAIRNQLVVSGAEITTLRAGDSFEFGNCTADVLWPPRGHHLIAGQGENNSSLVIRWTLHSHRSTTPSKSLLMTGDIEPETMTALLDRYPDLRANAIELPHHGSPSPALIRFVEHLNPSVVLQSTGRSRLDDPRLNEIRTPDRYWYTSADRGSAWVTIDPYHGVKSGWAMDD